MKTREISLREWGAMCNREESHFFDVKSSAITGKSLQKHAVSFANSDGGELIIGMKDKSDSQDPSNRWDGFSDLEAMNGLLQALFQLEPTLPLRFEVLHSEFKSGSVLRIEIDKSAEVMKTADKKVYQRHGAQSLPLDTPEKISQLAFAKGASSYEDILLPDIAPEQIVDSPFLADFKDQVVPSSDALDLAVNSNLLDYRTWQPRVAAALLFGEMPSALVPRKCSVKIARYKTREDDPEREHLAFQESVDGPLYELIQAVVSRVVEIMSEVKVWTVGGISTLDYPPEAIWETVTNAIIHRDYSISDDIQIHIFDDRIEILSPGRLPGYVTIENILDARYSRNTKIVKTLSRYKDPPNKDMDEGLNTAFQKMKEFGLKSPIISEEGNYLKVTLPHTPLAPPGDAIVKFLESNETITNRQAREITGIKSENLVKNEFYKLRDAGLIEQVPGLKGPKSAWRERKRNP